MRPMAAIALVAVAGALALSQLAAGAGDGSKQTCRGLEVTITEGPFRNWNAVISGELDARQRVALLLDFLGRQMEVRLPASDFLVQEDQPKRKIWNGREPSP